MLVLTRKVQQQIKVGDNITITIIRVKGQSVRVGIEAPRDVKVMRAELSAGEPKVTTRNRLAGVKLNDTPAAGIAPRVDDVTSVDSNADGTVGLKRARNRAAELLLNRMPATSHAIVSDIVVTH